jgi:tetratricopeptide (TPR) repeat protein
MAGVGDEALYTDYFANSVVRSAQGLLATLQNMKEPLPSEEVQTLVLHVLQFALAVDAAWPQAGTILLLLAPKMERAGHRDHWQSFLERGIEISQRRSEPKTEADLRFHLGMLHELRARFTEAAGEFTASARLHGTWKDQRGEARALNRAAYVARLQRQLADASQLVSQALALLSPQDPEWASCEFTQGTIAFDRRQWAEAEAHLRRALSLWQAHDDPYMIAMSLRNLGPVLHMQGRYDEALRCYEGALLLFEEHPDPLQQAITHMNLGIVYSLRGEPESALAFYALAEPIFRHTQDELRLASLYTNQGIEYRKLQQWQPAEEQCLQALQRWQALGNVRNAINVMDELGLVYAGQGRYEKAVAVLQEALSQLETISDDPGSSTLKETLLQDLGEVRRNGGE